MNLWESRILPRIIDKMLATGPVMRERAAVCQHLTGDVIEIGYGPAVTSVAAVEPSDAAWGLSGRRRDASAVRIERAGLDGQAIAAAAESFDSALTTFTLCTVPDPARALSELARVLKPGGLLAVLEHGLSPDQRVAQWQRTLDPLQRRIAGGCHLSRDVAALVLDAGFDVVSHEERYLPGPRVMRPWGYGYALIATRV
jgi:SAM-dependent methyltransferase